MKIYTFSMFCVSILASDITASMRRFNAKAQRSVVLELMKQCNINEAYEASKKLSEFNVRDDNNEMLLNLMDSAIKEINMSLAKIDAANAEWSGNGSAIELLNIEATYILRNLSDSYGKIEDRFRKIESSKSKKIKIALGDLGFVDFQIDKQKVRESSEYSVNQKHTDLDFNASNEKEREVSTSTATDAITALSQNNRPSAKVWR